LMKNARELNPSCSEIICKFSASEDTMMIHTDNYPNGAIDMFLDEVEQYPQAKGTKDMSIFPELEYVENNGGGGDWEYVELCWSIAKLYGIGMVKTREEAIELDEGEPTMEPKCTTCLKEKEPNQSCKDFVKRVVGECKGKFQETAAQKVKRLMKEARGE